MAEPQYKVGDRVRAKEAIYEPADDHAPGGYVCLKGDLLIVRKVRDKGQWPLSVSHEDVTDNSFSCGLDEVVPDGVMAAPATGLLPTVREFEELCDAHTEWLTKDVTGERYVGLYRAFKAKLAAAAGKDLPDGGDRG